jgi:hypothetical protein
VHPESWPDVFPGCDRALRFAHDPFDFICKQLTDLRAKGQAVNLARNGDFNSDKAVSFQETEVVYHDGCVPAGWDVWQAEHSKGSLTWDQKTDAAGEATSGPSGSARIAGAAIAYFIQPFRVQPGEYYVVSAVQRKEGKGHGAIHVRWQTAEGKWACEPQDVSIQPQEGGDQASPWRRMFGAVQVPDGAGRMVILLEAAGQTDMSDVIWYDGVEVFKAS